MKKINHSIQRELVAHQNIKEKKFWLNQLSGEPVKIIFPYDYQRHDHEERRFDEVTVEISADIFRHLQKLSRGSAYTLNTILVTAVVVLLHKYTGSTDIIVGAPIYKQDHELELINRILALRIRFGSDITFKELLMQVGVSIVETTENYNYPIEFLLKELNIPFTESGDFPLFDITVLLENIHDKNDIRHIHTNMMFSFMETGETVSGVVKYNSLLYKRKTIEGIVFHLMVLLEKSIVDVGLKNSAIDIVTEAEKTQLLDDFNDTKQEYPRHLPLHKLFEEEVEKSPHHIALVMDHQHVSYDHLNRQANRLARILRRNGVGAERIVGLLIHRSLDMMVAILGILKGGGAYLPIEPDTPKKRILSMLTDCRASLLLTDTACVKRHAFKGLQELQSTGPALWETPPRPQILNFNQLPIPDRSLVNYEIYNRNIGQAMYKNCIALQATRGCPYHCLYCHKIWPKKHVFRSAEHIFEEVLFYYKMGVRRFAFIDDIFNLNVKNSSRFFQLVIKNKLDIQVAFPNGIRGDILSKDYIDLMVEAGTIILAFALETASPRLQKLVGKNLNLEKFRENLEYFCEKYPQVIMELFTMHGFPSEAEEEAMMTLNFIKSIKWLHFPFVFILKIYPNTDMARFALENGVTLEQIYRSENLLYNELPETLPFEKSFTLKYQSDFFNNYILLKERLLHVLPHHMNTLSEDEIVQQYNANLPNEIRSFDDVLDAVRITKEELNNETCQDDMLMYVPHLHEKMKESFPSREPYSNALRVLLLDLSQYFSENRDIFYDIIEPPLGLMYLMTYLKQQLGRQINGKVAKSRIDFDNYKELKELLAAFKPDVIGIRTLSLFKDFFHETVSVIRNWGIDVPIIAGGPYATSAYQTILQDRNIDLVVRGEGEVTFCQLIEKIIEHDRKLPTTEILKEINGIAFIPRELERERTGREILIMEELADMMSTNPVENLTPVNGSENLAYIIFTSGTTGKPKGVMTTHYNVTRVVKNTNYIEINPLDRILQLSNYAFDGSVFDIFAAFLNDASLVLLRREEVLAAERLAGIIKRQAITVFFVTTALFNTLVDLEIECFANIRNVLFGGERVSVEHSRKALEYLGKHRIIHVYGPTETTVYATYYFIDTIDDCAGTIPIGKPIANTTAYILDKNFNLVPVGVSGEIYIGGYGLARGYLNRTELTAERFCLRRPGGTHFEKTAPPEPPRKNFLLDYPIYMTGDLGRWWEDGNIEFLGRKDHQVKIRGFRIELGEIESQLLRHPGIKNAIVNVIEGKTGNTYLCTYYVPAPISPRLSASELSLYLAKELPDYMIPAYFILLDHLPLTPTGKIDRKALPVPGAGEEIEYVAPRNKREEDLTEIWANVLGIEKNKISIDSDFFKLGGNSLNATVIMARIHKTFNIKIPLQELFINPTIREFSQYMKAFDRDLFVSIGPAEKKEYYRLSSAQKRQFVLHQMDTDTIVYHIPQVVVLEGKLDKDRLSHTFKKLIERHESLRTSFCMVEDRPVQRIWEDVPLENRYIGIPEFEAEVKEKDRTPCIEDHIKNFIRPFDLTRAPLLRVKLIKEHEDKHIMMVDIHHIIADGTSMNVLVKEFMVLYAGEELPPLKLRYKDFSEWQNSRQQKEAVNLQKAYWLEEFTGDVPVINLPTDYPRAPSPGYEGSSVTFKLSVEQTRALNDLALDCGGTLYMMLLGIYFVLLSKLSGQEDIVIGTPTAGRKHTDLEQIIGMFVNTLALRNYPCGEKTYKAFFNHIKEKTLKAFENQDYQYEELVDLVARNRDLNRNPLFDTMFVLQNTSLQEIEIPGLRVAPYEYENKTSKFDLTLTCVEVEAKLLCIFEYSTKLFKRETIEGFFTYFKNIAEGVINDINRRLGDLEPLTDDEKTRLLLDFNDTETVYPTNKRLHELFVEQVEQTPDHIAVFGPSPGTIHELPAQVTYRELNQKSDQLADALMKRGIQADMIVGIMVNRSVEIVASILGILKSGGVYMPIDPDYPQERINYILADSAAKIQLTADAINRLPTPPHLHLAPWINAPGTEVSSFSTLTSTSTCQVSPANLAYVIYTSGSTGKPKGVLIQHNNVVNQMVGLQKRYAFETGFHHILLAPFTFDPSVQQIFLPLISGGKLHLVPRSCIDYPQELLRYIVSKQIDIVNTVPSLMDLLLDHARDHKKLFFKYIILAGELFSTGLHRKLRSSVNVEKLINIYGPAEATINTTCYECQEVETVIPIGRPLMNYKLVILDKYLKLIPIGVGGEISIMGKGISRGYMNQPELTQQKFIRFPQAPEDRMYMTGDLGKWLPDGNIEFLGRIDHQLKIRGIRIELGEIENILLSHHEIKETVVVSKATERGDAYLCAYIISNKEIQVSELRKYLSTYLPHYMIPSYFVKLAKIPMTAHGKIDRNSLPEPEELILRDDVHYIPPATVMEKKLVEIWEKVLGRNNIGINENFFLMGGDSIKAIQIISRMNSAGYKLEMKDLFQYPVISELAPQVRKLKRIPDQSTITGTLPLTPIQKMFFDRTFLGSFHYHHFNQAVMFYSSQELDKEIIKKVFSKIQAHHDALRMTYKINTDSREVIQINNGLDHPLSLQEYDLKNQENSLKELQYKVNEIQSGIDIEKGPLMRLGLFHLDDGDRILIVIHHLVIDGISWRILVEDLETLYGQYQRGEKPVLPPKTDSFKHWAQSLSEYANSNTLLKEKAYWNQWEANIVPAIRKDFEVNENAVKDTRTISFTMEEEETKLLFTKVNRGFNTDINDILLTALGLGIKKAFEQDRVLLALEGHGREEVLEDMDISRTVGWFTSIYPAVLDMSYAGDLGRQVKEIKETLRRIPHKGLGYGILKYLTAEGFKKESQFKLNPQISFNYLGQFDVDETQISFFEIAKESTGNMQSLKNQRSHDLDVSGMTTANRLTMTFSYNKTHFKPETIASLFNHVQSQLKQIITFCCSKEKMELTPCDFTYKGLSI
ncbi:MAG: amino acid adenylation domain-containing protein, partial [Candidatus Aminicenantes bacterium]